MKLSLRVTLTTMLVTLILLTVLALGYNNGRNVRFTAEDLTSQILDQTWELVDSQVDDLVRMAGSQGRLNRELLRERDFDAKAFDRLARYWISVLETNPRLSRESIVLEATGEWSFVRRTPGGKLAIGELRRDRSTDVLGMNYYWREGFPEKPFRRITDANDRDPRKLPWYAATAKVRHQVWSQVDLLGDLEGFGHVPGVCCCTPVLADDGSFQGVLTSSFDVISLCNYLRGLKVGEGGFAFVVEAIAGGERRVIAHPDPSILIRKAGDDGNNQIDALVPSEELADGRVPAFLREVPRVLDPRTAGQTSRVLFEHEGVSFIGAYRRLSSPGSPDWLICVMIPEKDVMGRVLQSNRETGLISVAILATALLAGLYVSAQIARPLERVVRETAKIGKFEVEARPVAHSMIREVDDLANVVEETKTGLRSFGKYVPTDLIRQMFATGREATLGGERRRMTISFCDLANFTTLAEKLPPEELVQQMGDYFARFSADIVAENGTVDKYIGDAIMAFWNAPGPCPNHAIAACITALRNQETMEVLNAKWAAEGNPRLSARVGIMTGEVVVGNIGSPARLNYTAMGDSVNLASRLEGLGKYYGTHILMGEPTYLEASEVVLARPVDRVSVKGKTEGMIIYELLAMKEGAGSGLEELVSLSNRALEPYNARDWDGALVLFEEIERLRPGDGPAKVLADRCRAFRQAPPPDDWDGVHHMTSK